MASLSQDFPVSSTVSGSFSTSSFSSLSDPSSSTFASQIPTPTDNDNDNGMPAVSRSSSLLFGFLITFLALFIGFMACGYSSRRASQIRGARYAGQLRDGDFHRPLRMKKPRLWDIWVDEGTGRNHWKDMMPLSTSLVHPGPEEKHLTQSSVDVTSTPPALRESEPPQEYFPSFYLGSRAFGRSSYPVLPPNRSRRTSPRMPSEPTMSTFVLPPSNFRLPSSSFSPRSQNRGRNKSPEEVASVPNMEDVHAQISVLIAMPSPTASTQSRKFGAKSIGGDEGEIFEESGDGPPYCEIGVARVPIPGLTEQRDLRDDGQQ